MSVKPQHGQAQDHPDQNKIGIVSRFECVNYLQSKSFIVSTLVMALIIIIIVSLPNIQHIFSVFETQTKQDFYFYDKAGLHPDTKALAANIPDLNFIVKDKLSEKEIEDLVNAPNSYGVFITEGPFDYTWRCRRLHLDNAPQKTVAHDVATTIKARVLNQAGLRGQIQAHLLNEPQLKVIELAELSGKSQAQTLPYTYVLIMLLYIAILSYGQLTATSVASEKGSRTMEILITSTKPKYLIHGKVLGTGMAGVLQMLFIGCCYYLAYTLNGISLKEAGGTASFLQSALGMPFPTFMMALVIFVLSYLSFAYLYAALGSLVSRSEEVSQVISPITTIYIGVFMAAIFASFSPDRLWVTILSFIPLFGTLIYFVRYSMLSLSVLELILPLLIHIVTVGLCAMLAIRLYRRGVLRYTNGVKFRDIRKLLRKEEA